MVNTKNKVNTTSVTPPLQVNVKRHPQNNYKIATYNFSDVSGYHWSKVSGGNKQRTINWTLFAYVTCDKMISGQIDHSGIHDSCPHNIKVAVTRKDNRNSFDYLANLAEPKPENTNRKALTTAQKADIIYLMWTAKTAAPAYNGTGVSGTPDIVYENTENASFIQRCMTRNLNWALISPTGCVWLPGDLKTHDAKRLNTLTQDKVKLLTADIKNKLSLYSGGIRVYTCREWDRTDLHKKIIVDTGLPFLMIDTIKDVGVK